ncbi:transcriptional regulator, XRE family [mine drainage metagenome]|uniref:Transcriptional regulator, XRE family n=1 Tax=mine drainage metagenome TaxID=410659 RepID=T1B196_9ZZZZ
MEECELCGNKTANIYVVDVEGVELRVCAKCAKGKRVISKVDTDARKTTGKQFQVSHSASKQQEEAEIIDDYGKVIREARERMKIPINALAEMINEKETLLYRVENQKTLPTQALARKLEKALNIKLERDMSKAEDTAHGNKKESATLGEFMH